MGRERRLACLLHGSVAHDDLDRIETRRQRIRKSAVDREGSLGLNDDVSLEDDDLFKGIRKVQNTGGAVPSAFDCWLVLRGIRTLPYRMRAHSENAGAVAAFLNRHPSVEAVYYPGLEEHHGHSIAARQMSLFGGMISVQVKGGKEAAIKVAAEVRLFTRATSLGGTGSLIEHRASIENYGVPKGQENGTPENLLRMSIGLENPEDLVADLEQALG